MTELPEPIPEPHPARVSEKVPEWNCPGCNARATGEYCGECGEHRPHPESLYLRHFFEGAIESFFHADGRLWSTLRLLLFAPGELTVAFIEGKRKKYLGPVQLFLLVNLLYFLIQSFTGWNTFSSPLQLHVTDFAYRDLAHALLDHHLTALNLTYQQYEPIFNHSVGLHAKSLVILMVPLLMIPVALLFWRKRRLLVPHLTFATHFLAFDMLVLCVAQPLTSLIVKIIVTAGFHPTWMAVDKYLSGAVMIVQLAYLFFAVRRVYPQYWIWSAVKTGLLLLSLDYVVLSFRFLLFLITLYAG